jgi:hypothetical protein
MLWILQTDIWRRRRRRRRRRTRRRRRSRRYLTIQIFLVTFLQKLEPLNIICLPS